jgi:hypothetical protein
MCRQLTSVTAVLVIAGAVSCVHSPCIGAIGPGPGVKAEYFCGTDPAGEPILTRIENSIDHNWGAGEVAGGLSDQVCARWTADLEVPFSGTYQLITTTDDGVRLWLDGRLLINNWMNRGVIEEVADVELISGQMYLLQMEWYENTGNAIARLSWQGPSIARGTIPAGPLHLPLWATTPYPANMAANVPQTLALRWHAGDSTAHHDIYFSDDPDAVADANRTTTGVYRARQPAGAMTYDLGALEWGKTYFWRVDEVNTASPDSPWRGSVWSFTTADSLVVDDFESYTNDVGNRVFHAWRDGYGFTEPQLVEGNGTRAVVGHDIWSTESPHYGATIVETYVVHSGTQSMPMGYDNLLAPYCSETERTWAMPQNWTTNGMDTLVLYIQGTASNTPARLYVTVQDNARQFHAVTHDGSAILTEGQWSEWKIPLAKFSNAGVNVTAVKTVCIGTGERDVPGAAGVGTIYIDDIRVIRSE